ncbi:MAG TPA: DUF362 domain-containing protein [Candidatus Binatia bacterium]|nr:DUF362 domain-containing protein [Candidatus Binatia bacterium]
MEVLGLAWDELVSPGQHVLLKPNMIRQSHSGRPHEWTQILTHGQVLSAVARAIAGAMHGEGRITIADAPQTDSDFEAIGDRMEIPALLDRVAREFPGVRLSVVDLRREVWRTADGIVTTRKKLPDAPGGYACIDLGGCSSLTGKAGPFYGADYDSGFTARHHSDGKHEYLLARIALDADLFVNLPKLKTHKKVGLTLSLKNLVGINGDKNYLPHFSMGTPRNGGDELPGDGFGSGLQARGIHAFKRVLSAAPGVGVLLGPAAKRIGTAVFGATEDVVRSGNWYGNDTAWRMVHDLNKILFHYGGDGERRSRPLRYLSIADGIIAGEGNGPMEADALACGVLLAGTNPVAVDWTAAALMGFDWEKIPMIREAFAPSELPITTFRPESIEILPELGAPFRFRPHFGWAGQVEAGL